MGLSRRAGLALALAIAAAPAGHALAAAGVPSADDMSLGSAKAKIQVVEYASASCPHCAHFNETIFPAFKAKYVDTGKVRYTLKEFLTSPAQVAAAGFLISRCTGPSKYFTTLDGVFRSQSQWAEGNIRDVLLGVAKANGLSDEQFDACLKDEAALKALNERFQRNIADGVDSTPTFFVNGKKVAVGSLADLDKAIAAAGAPGKKGGGR